MRADRDEQINAHFTGSIVYIERGLSTVTNQEPLSVIDWQQRLTTRTLLITALAKHFATNGLGEVLGAFDSFRNRQRYFAGYLARYAHAFRSQQPHHRELCTVS